jgi:hypothetical protein
MGDPGITRREETAAGLTAPLDAAAERCTRCAPHVCMLVFCDCRETVDCLTYKFLDQLCAFSEGSSLAVAVCCVVTSG